MAPSISDEDARDLELQRELQEAYDVLLRAPADERALAKSQYLKLLRTFSARVLERELKTARELSRIWGDAPAIPLCRSDPHISELQKKLGVYADQYI
jgi:hypothetical protein